MGEIRDRVLLATRTGLRDQDSAWRQINESLERLLADDPAYESPLVSGGLRPQG